MGASNRKGRSFTVETGDNEETQFLNWDSEARVDYVTVEGLKRTQNDVLENAMQDLFSAKTFSGMIEKISYVTERLNNLDSFLDIKVYIDVNRSKTASRNGYRVIYKLEEKGYARLQSNLALGDNEGVFVVKSKLLNLKGRGEKIEATYSYSTGKTADTNISFVKPLLTRLPTLASASLFHHATQELESGYRLKESGILLNMEVHPLPKMIQNVQYEGVMRNLSPLSRNVAFQVREHSGPTLKSSLRHIFSYDLRDSPVFPKSGILLGSKSEFAGLGGNISFLKNESFFHLYVPLLRTLTGQFTLNFGVMKQIDGNKIISMCDNLFLGGPLSVRGFASRGIGSQSDGCSLGMNSYWASGFHLYSHMPFLPQNSVIRKVCRTHLFINFGAPGPFNLSHNFSDNMEELTKNMRAAYGLGLCFHIGPSRIELNCCLPLLYSRSDSIIRGFQISVVLDPYTSSILGQYRPKNYRTLSCWNSVFKHLNLNYQN